MYSRYEPKIIKSLAITGLAAAFLFAIFVTFNSGVLGGGKNSSADTTGAIGSSTAAADQGAQPAKTATTGTRSHIVADGDSFYSIARKYNVTIAEISQLNPNVDPQNLTSGTRLTIP